MLGWMATIGAEQQPSPGGARGGSNLALFGLQSDAAPLQAASRTVPRGLSSGATKRISRQSAMSGPLPELCSVNAAIARPPAGTDCAAGHIHARSRDFADVPNEPYPMIPAGPPQAQTRQRATTDTPQTHAYGFHKGTSPGPNPATHNQPPHHRRRGTAD